MDQVSKKDSRWMPTEDDTDVGNNRLEEGLEQASIGWISYGVEYGTHVSLMAAHGCPSLETPDWVLL